MDEPKPKQFNDRIIDKKLETSVNDRSDIDEPVSVEVRVPTVKIFVSKLEVST